MGGTIFRCRQNWLLPMVVGCLVVALAAAPDGGPGSPGRASAATCKPLAAVFYVQTDWLRLARALASDPSPCADYYISVPALVGHKWDPRPGQAAQIRSLGPRFHAMAEIHWNGWSKWIADNGSTWYDAGVQARKSMAAAGYDVAAGDLWAINEFHSGIRRNVGVSRDNARNFVRGLYEGDGALPTSRGVVFNIGMGQHVLDTAAYKEQLESWFDDAPFWADMQRFVRYWGQEVYADSRNWGVASAALGTRRDYLNEFLRHPAVLAHVAPDSAATARAFLDVAYTPIANAAWQWQASSGYGSTSISSLQMSHFVSTETYALRSPSAGNRFGFAWAPSDPAFAAETAAILARLASAIHHSGEDGSGEPGAGACFPPGGGFWCGSQVEGAWFNDTWKSFAFRGDFTISAMPQSVAVPRGAARTYAVRIGSSRGFAEEVNLSVTGLPPRSTATFSPATVAAPSVVTLTVVTSRSTPLGTYVLTISGRRAPTVRSAAATLVVRRSPNVISGTPGADVLIGTSGADVIRGRGGNDTIRGRGGDDLVAGGSGSDTLLGGRGRDRLLGGTGRDTLLTRDGRRDRLYGGPGLDRAHLDPRLDLRRSIERRF